MRCEISYAGYPDKKHLFSNGTKLQRVNEQSRRQQICDFEEGDMASSKSW